MALEFRATLDYRSRPFLQLALCSFEEWSPDLHMQVLSQSYSFGHIAQLWILFHNLSNLVPEARVLASQIIPGHGRFSSVRLPHTR
jgi:hypothetical protein